MIKRHLDKHAIEACLLTPGVRLPGVNRLGLVPNELPVSSRLLLERWWLPLPPPLLLVEFLIPTGRVLRVAEMPLFLFSSSGSSFRASDNSSGWRIPSEAIMQIVNTQYHRVILNTVATTFIATPFMHNVSNSSSCLVKLKEKLQPWKTIIRSYHYTY